MNPQQIRISWNDFVQDGIAHRRNAASLITTNNTGRPKITRQTLQSATD